MFSIIMPIDSNRLEQFLNTKRVYDSFSSKKEFVMPTRTYKTCYSFMKKNNLLKDVRLIPYKVDQGFNPSKALNIGVRESKSDYLIITGPEVKPTTEVLVQLEDVADENIICQVFDQDIEGNLTSLVNNNYRNTTPQPYFLALFQRSAIEQINGWDEDFMKGYAYEDNDFGNRWVRAGIPFRVREDIQAVHQYHPRLETIHQGSNINSNKWYENDENRVIKPKNGLIKIP